MATVSTLGLQFPMPQGRCAQSSKHDSPPVQSTLSSHTLFVPVFGKLLAEMTLPLGPHPYPECMRCRHTTRASAASAHVACEM